MRQDEAAKLKAGSRLRLKQSGHVLVVTRIEPSGRIIYGLVNGTGREVVTTNKDVRPEVPSKR